MTKDCKYSSKKFGAAERVLVLLAEAEGWRSGEEISEKLGVSRAAVAKQVSVLRGRNHVIEASTNRGYLLRLRYEPTEYDCVAPHLKTRVLGRKGWKALAETVSTNTEAITWALAGGEEGAVVTAETQTRGKGRKGDDWFSSPHGLQFSVVLRPRGLGDDESGIIGAALEAVAEAIISVTGLEAEIKEPNDLLIGGKKNTGVLVEAGSRAGEPDWLALGIGCNVNVLPEEFPAALRGRVTSLYEATGCAVEKNRLLAEILNAFEKKLRALRK